MMIALRRLKAGRSAKTILVLGRSGVEQKMLLARMAVAAEAIEAQTIQFSASISESLPTLLAPEIYSALLRLSRIEEAEALASRGLRALAGFTRALAPRYPDIVVCTELPPELGLADNGDLESDLATLLETAGEAAKAADTMLVMFVDQLHELEIEQLAALIAALHRCVQRQLPVMLVGTGQPDLRARAGQAKSYAERMFDFVEVES